MGSTSRWSGSREVGEALDDLFRELVSIWRADAQRIRRYDPSSDVARGLETCADDAEKVIGRATPEWIAIQSVAARTGWSVKKLRGEFARLADERVPGTEVPLARRSPRWELHRTAIDRIRPKPGSNDMTRATSIQELARALAGDQ